MKTYPYQIENSTLLQSFNELDIKLDGETDDYNYEVDFAMNDGERNNPHSYRETVDYAQVEHGIGSSLSLTVSSDNNEKRSQSVRSWDTVWEEELGYMGGEGSWDKF